MIYRLLGRGLWLIFRGYFRHSFPNARRNLAIAGIAAVVVAAGVTGARRRSAPAANQKA
jgi:hypothetical protein